VEVSAVEAVVRSSEVVAAAVAVDESDALRSAVVAPTVFGECVDCLVEDAAVLLRVVVACDDFVDAVV
jgi:hypothetical protein